MEKNTRIKDYWKQIQSNNKMKEKKLTKVISDKQRKH